MAEENKQSGEAQAASDVNAQKIDDFKTKYESLQGEHQKVVEQLRSAQTTIDTLDQYGAINWDKISGKPTQQPSDVPPEPPDVVQQLRTEIQRQEGRQLLLQFRLDNPDLREYEDDLVQPFVLRARARHPRESIDAIMKRSSDDVRAFLKKHEESVIARQKADKAKEDLEKASGLESAAKTSPESEVDEHESRQKYVEARRQRKAKQTRMA